MTATYIQNNWNLLEESLTAFNNAIGALPLTSKGSADQNRRVQERARHVILRATLAGMDLGSPLFEKTSSLFKLLKRAREQFSLLRACGTFERLISTSKTETATSKAISTCEKLISPIFEKQRKVEETRVKNERTYSDKLLGGEGNCVGYTLTHLSDGCPQSSDEISKSARFVQTAYRLTFLFPSASAHSIYDLGNCVLAFAELFADQISKIKKICGEEGAKNPHLIGRLLLKQCGGVEGVRLLFIQKIEELELEHERLTIKHDQLDLEIDALSDDLRDSTSPVEIEQLEKERAALLDEALAIDKQRTKNREMFGELEYTKNTLAALPGFRDEVPAPIMNRLALKKCRTESEQLFDQLENQLKSEKDNPGKFQIIFKTAQLSETGDAYRHSILLSFSPAYFLDPNDTDPTTLEPVERRFKNADEMIEGFKSFLLRKYGPDYYKSFALTVYDKTPSTPAGNAFSGLGVFLEKHLSIFPTDGLSPLERTASHLRGAVLRNPLILEEVKKVVFEHLGKLEEAYTRAKQLHQDIHEEIAQVKKLAESCKEPQEREELIQKWEGLWEKETPVRAEHEKCKAALEAFKSDIPSCLYPTKDKA